MRIVIKVREGEGHAIAARGILGDMSRERTKVGFNSRENKTLLQRQAHPLSMDYCEAHRYDYCTEAKKGHEMITLEA
jgi:hypothetical protein